MTRGERLLLAYLLAEKKPKPVERISPFLGRGGGISRIQDAGDVDSSAIGDGKVPVFRTASMKHEYETGGGGGGAPTDAEYVVTALNPTLTAEKLHSALTGADLHDPKAHNQALSTITEHDKAAHDALGLDHGSLSGLSPDDDHTQYLNTTRHDVTDRHPLGTVVPHDALASLTEKSHASLTNVTADQHHTEAHTLASHSTKAHSELTDVTADQHHARLHALGSASDHSGSGTIKTTLSFAVVGTLTVGTDKAPTILAPCSLIIVKVKLVVKTAPTGAAIIVDVNKNGTTIFTTQANRPQIAAGATTGDSGTPDVTALAETDKITIDIDQVGSTVAGADLTVEVVCNQTVVFS